MEQGELEESPDVIELSPDIELSMAGADIDLSSPDERRVEYRKEDESAEKASSEHEESIYR